MTVIRLPSMVMGAYPSIVMLDTSWPSPLHALRVDAVADQEGGLRVSQLVEVVADVELPLAAALLGLSNKISICNRWAQFGWLDVTDRDRPARRFPFI